MPARSTEGRLSGLRHVAGPFYFMCLLFVLIPAVDMATNSWPLRLDDVGWRFGTAGLLSGFLLTPLLGMVLAVAGAHVMGHSRTVLVLGVLSALGAAALIGIAAVFTLDALQLHPQVSPEGQFSYRVGAIRAWAKTGVVAIALIWLAIASFRAPRLQER